MCLCENSRSMNKTLNSSYQFGRGIASSKVIKSECKFNSILKVYDCIDQIVRTVCMKSREETVEI